MVVEYDLNSPFLKKFNYTYLGYISNYVLTYLCMGEQSEHGTYVDNRYLRYG